ncbi:acyl-CoA dehydrogenase [uncultured Arthrobacter sp.]|uniref:acyl-CoA dehydrogenase n=1 Tax=uncultured Arthrobacter sp. TaxID=114050 RepID=UPI002638874D|nr:acyl-CoA dehydrogenase [uncultured Arthrobacter sp.]
MTLQEEKLAHDGLLQELADRTAAARGSVPDALSLAADLGTTAPLPGTGRTPDIWRILSTLAATDLSVARAVEPHLDALAILDQAGLSHLHRAGAAGTWGVFAAEGPGVAVSASTGPDGWILTGTKPWCSLADHLDHAIITAHVGDGGRRAFAVDLRAAGVVVDPPDAWVSRGLTMVTSCSVHLDGAAATPVGGTDWYLHRDGFAWGGIGVAACWLGGALGIARTMLAAAGRRTPDQVALLHLGRVDAALHEARTVLGDAADAVDAGRASGQDGALLAARVRSSAFRCAELVLDAAAHGLGPAPLAFDETHAARVADLTLYLRQHHAERDDAALGDRVLARSAEGNPEW